MRFTIAVTNLNEAPTNIELSNSSVVEHEIGAVIGNLTVSDVDSTNFTYTATSNLGKSGNPPSVPDLNG